MYDDDYEEYMRNVLGYDYMSDYRNYYNMMPMNTYGANMTQEMYMMDDELEECYPEIYKIVYPMVQKVCMKNTKPITKELVDDMVEEIYSNIEPDNSININVNVGNTSTINSLSSDRDTKTPTAKPEVKSKYVRENRGDEKPKETRQRNFLLNDLVRILVLRELLGRPGRPGRSGNRPPQRPPMRPPFPGGRPPFRPRGEFDHSYGIYEY